MKKIGLKTQLLAYQTLRIVKIKFSDLYIEVRVIAATNQDLQGLRRKGLFRDDFYYRLCSDSIQVPPLRQRLREDPAEMHRLLTRTVERILGSSSEDLVIFIHQTIEQSLPQDYHWPGNVRELEQCTRRILLKRGYEGDMSGREPAVDLKTMHAKIGRGRRQDSIQTTYCRLC